MSPELMQRPFPEIDQYPPPLRAFFRTLFRAIAGRTQQDFQDLTGALRATGEAFVAESSRDIARWTGLLAAGAIDQNDLTWLIDGRAQVARMDLLAKAGLSRSEVDRFRATLVETIVGTAIAYFLGRD